MSQVVRIPEGLYKRLSLHAEGFETPANVIEKILDFFEKQTGLESSAASQITNPNIPPTLEILYYPTNEEAFKQLLLKTKRAYILLHNIDGTTELREWNAKNFTVSSSVNGNLRSGYLRGWKNKGIIKVELSTNRADLV